MSMMTSALTIEIDRQRLGLCGKDGNVKAAGFVEPGAEQDRGRRCAIRPDPFAQQVG